jgi:small nuclear ribonucleoprotein (snRNP)-like protein
MLGRRDRVLRGLVRYRMVVTMLDDATWDGVLIDVDDRTLVLRDVSAIQKDGTRVPADGEVLLPRADISYIQHVPAMQRP